MAITIEIKAVPASGRQKIVRDKSGIIKCYLKSAPEDGKANAELIKLLSNLLKIPQQQIILIAGATARKKKVSLQTTQTLEQIYTQLGLEQQNIIA